MVLVAGCEGAPDWMKNATVAKSLDARPVIAGGGHPLEQVLRELKELPAGQYLLADYAILAGAATRSGEKAGSSGLVAQERRRAARKLYPQRGLSLAFDTRTCLLHILEKCALVVTEN